MTLRVFRSGALRTSALLLFQLACATHPDAPPVQTVRVVLDTDANNELDDQHAIAYLLFNGDRFDVEGITVNRTYNGGSIDEQMNEAVRVVRLSRLEGQVPVLKGADASFEEIAPHVEAPSFDGSEAVHFILSRAHAPRPVPLVLLAVGKLTNVALAVRKDPSVSRKVRVVWLGSNYPDPGEYNQENDEGALQYLLDADIPFEMVLVRGGKASGTDAVRVTLPEMRARMAGRGPPIRTGVSGRHGGEFKTFGDYSISLFEHAEMYGNPPSRALFDMAAVAIVKNPSWAKSTRIPAPQLVDGKWVARPSNVRLITIWEHFDRRRIVRDFFQTMDEPRLPRQIVPAPLARAVIRP